MLKKFLLTGFILAVFIVQTQGQCDKDTDCKGDRICVNGECVDPDNTGQDTEKRVTTNALVNQKEYKVEVHSKTNAYVAVDNIRGWFPTPHTIRLKKGSHFISLKKGGFSKFRFAVDVEDKNLRIDTQMHKKKGGVLTLGIIMTVYSVMFIAFSIAEFSRPESDTPTTGISMMITGIGLGTGSFLSFFKIRKYSKAGLYNKAKFTVKSLD